MFRHIITFLISLFICTAAQAQPSAVYSDCADINGCVPNAITASSNDVLSNKKFSDNVGIGTPSPTSKLHVHGGGIKGELLNKGWEMIPMDQDMNPSGVTFSEVNSMTVMDGELYIGYDIDGSSGVIRSPVYKWDGTNLTFLSNLGGGTGSLYGGAAFLIEYKGLLYGGLQSNAVGGGDVYVSADKGSTWNKSFENTETHFAYSAAVFKGKLYVGLGYSNGHIYSFDGTTWTKVYDGTGVTGLIVSLHVSKGRIFAATGNTNEMILSSDDGTNWTVEESSPSTYTEINHFVDFRGKLYVNVIGSSNNILVRDDVSGTWSIAYLDLPGNQCWGMNEYNNVLYVGCSQSPNGAIIFKSKDGFTFEEDIQFNTLGTSYEYEAFKMINYNGSMYVGVGGDGRYSANLWRKTDSLGQLFDTDHKIVKQFVFNTHGTNWADMSQLEAVIPMSFQQSVSIGTTLPGKGMFHVLNGNVGIGTSNPGESLEIFKDGTGRGNLRIVSPGALYLGGKTAFLVSTGASANGIDWYTNNSKRFGIADNGLTGFGTAVNVGLGTFAPNAKLSIIRASGVPNFAISTASSALGDQLIVTSGGNVGVATSSPVSKLQVVGTVTATSFTGSGAGLTDLPSGSGTVSSGTADRVAIYDTAGETIVSSSVLSDNNTNIGIGTTGPREKLEVAGNVRATGFIGSLTGNADTASTSAALTSNGSNCSAGSGAGGVDASGASEDCLDFIQQSELLDEDTMSSDSATQPASQQSIKAYVDTAIAGVSGGAGGWTDGGPNVYTTATSDSVGIGTTTPNSASLEIVKQSTLPPLKISGSALGNGNFLTVTSAGAIGIGTTNPTSLNANWLVGLYSSSNGNRAMAVQNPNTGTSAQARFEVKTSDANGFIGNVPTNFAGSSSWSGRTMLMAESGNGLALIAGSGAGDIDFLTNSTTRAMRITGSSLAMGTTTPTGRMDIRGDEVRIWTGAGTNTNATSSGELYVEGDLEVDGTIYGNLTGNVTGNADTATTATTASNLGADGVDALTEIAQSIKTAANDTSAIVVGTAGAENDCAKWDASGNLVTAGAACGSGSGGINNVVEDTTPQLGGDLDVNGKTITSASNGNVIITPNGTGRVGIGTVGPTQALQVVGTISATAFTGDGSGLTAIGASALATDSVSADELNATGVEAELEAVLDLQDQQGAVTDSQVPNTITVDLATTATTANAGDSATAFFSSGAIERARGGTAADTSAYGAGILGSDGSNNTIDIDTIAEVETAIGGATNILTETEIDASSELVAIMDDETGTGALVFAGGDIGAATATTPAEDDNDTSVATTAYVQTEISGLGSGAWIDGGTNVYVSPTTDNVGIGTTTPTAALLVENAGTQTSFRVNDSVVDASPFVITSTGNVGVGTFNPVVKFVVQESDTTTYTAAAVALANASIINPDTTVNNMSQINYVTGTSTGVLTSVARTGMIVTDHTNGSVDGDFFVTVKSNDTLVEALRAKSDGAGAVLVGIGTSSPVGRLNVVGDELRVGNGGTNTNATGAGEAYVQNDLEVDGMTYSNVTGALTGNADTVTFADAAGDTTTFVALGTAATGSLAPATDAGISYNASTNALTAGSFIGDGSGLTGIGAGGWSDGGTNVYTSTTTDLVGIGTTTPSTTLELVKQSSNALLMVSSTATGDGDVLIITSGGNVGIGTLLPRGPLDLGPTGTLYAQTITGPTGPTVLGTSNNVGIGTIIAGSLLTVGSTGQVTVTSAGAVTTSSTVSVADDAYAAGWNGSTAVPTKNAVYDKIETIGASSWTDSGPFLYVTTTTDNVGIGTVAPDQRLKVEGASATNISSMVRNSNSSGLASVKVWNSANLGFEMVATGSGYAVPNTYGVLATAGEKLSFGESDGTINLTIDGNGNIGIGSSAPDSILNIPSIKSTTGTRYLCIGTTGRVTSSASACSGT